MNHIIQPWQLAVAVVAAWVNREQQVVLRMARENPSWGYDRIQPGC